jgi:hypothetical protein
MTSIHPKLALVTLRSDGEEGLELVVKTVDGQVHDKQVGPELAARWLEQLSGFVAERLRAGAIKE